MRTVELTPRLRSVAELGAPGGAVCRCRNRPRVSAGLAAAAGEDYRGSGLGSAAGAAGAARGTAEKYGLTGRMDFRLCDGLSGIQPDEVNTIAIAGMGGETIAAILAAAPWTWERECLLLLQPMSAQPFLRRWLQAHSYTIRRELLSREGDTLYTTFEVYAGPMAELTPAELWAGRQTRGEGSPLRLAYLDRLLRQTERAIAGLKRSKRPEDASRLAELEQVHQGLLDTKEEWLSWQR